MIRAVLIVALASRPAPRDVAVLPGRAVLADGVLVDGGERGDLLGWVRRQGVRRLDRVVCTGGRARCGALVRVVAAMPVGEVRVPAQGAPKVLVATARARGVPVVTLPRGPP